ncbi:hypothetical protein K1719_038761 [Acacia pycnantha]|nr:hypothetical protein K1719_038761 [Acacia pycnantha]
MSSSSHPLDQIIHSMNGQLPFSSMKLSFVALADYHRFAPDQRRPTDQEAETIVIKSPAHQYFLWRMQIPSKLYLSVEEEAKLLTVDIKLDILCFAAKELPLSYAVSSLVIPGLVD